MINATPWNYRPGNGSRMEGNNEGGERKEHWKGSGNNVTGNSKMSATHE